MIRISCIFVLVCSMNSFAQESIEPPVAEKSPTRLEKHNQVRVDEYYWLRERENPKVIEYLNQENEYMEAMTKDLQSFKEKLAAETKARIKQDDSSVPYEDRGYLYYSRTEEGAQTCGIPAV